MTSLSKKCQYALHALAYIAECKEPTIQIGKICESRSIPRKFLEAILLDLCKGDILGSKRGNGGGYYLKKKPGEISLIQVIQLVDGGIDLLPCASVIHTAPCETCTDEVDCRLRKVFGKVSGKTYSVLSGTFISDIANKKGVYSKRKSSKENLVRVENV